MNAVGALLGPALLRMPVVAILRGTDPDAAFAAAAAVAASGIGVLEITIESPGGRAALAAVASAPPAGLVVGAGTVRTPAEAVAAAELGASFTVSPGLSHDVLRLASQTGLPHLPGVATPTEVLAALDAGATWLKAFPAATLGAGWIRAMAGPFPEARFVATGGVAAGTAAAYLEAGAVGVGVTLRGDVREQLDGLLALTNPGS